MRSLVVMLVVLVGSVSALLVDAGAHRYAMLSRASAARAPSPRLISGFDLPFGDKEKGTKKKDASGGPALPSLPELPGGIEVGANGKVKSTLLALPVLAAGAALPVIFIFTIAILGPGNQLPFNFLDKFYPPRVTELATIKAKRDAAEAKAAAEKKAADAAAAAAAAEAEKAAAAAAAAKPAAAAKK